MVDPRRLGDRGADRRRRPAAPQPLPGHRPRRSCWGFSTSSSPRARGRRAVPRRADHRLGRRAPLGRRLVAGARRRGDRRAGAGTCARGARCSRPRRPRHGGAGAMVLTGRGAEQHTDGTDTVRRRSTSRSRSGLPGRSARATAASPARATGRAVASTARSATSCPGYRRIDGPRGPRHVAAVWGVEPGRPARAQGVPAVELLALARRRGAALLVHGSNPVVSAPDADARARSGWRHLDLLVVVRLRAQRDAELADVVLPVTQWAEEEGTMTSLEGRVLRRREAVDPPARCAASSRCSPTWPSGSAARRLGDDPADGLRRAAAAQRRRPRRLLRAQPRPAGRREAPGWHWPAAGPTPGRRGCSRDRFAHRRRPRPVVPVERRRTGRRPARDAPVYLVTGRVLAQYQSGAQTRRVPSCVEAAPRPVRRDPPQLARRLGIADGRRRARHLGRGDGRTAPPGSPPTIRPGHGVHAVPLGRRGSANAAHQRRDRPGLRDARVQGVRGDSRCRAAERRRWRSTSR